MLINIAVWNSFASASAENSRLHVLTRIRKAPNFHDLAVMKQLLSLLIRLWIRSLDLKMIVFDKCVWIFRIRAFSHFKLRCFLKVVEKVRLGISPYSERIPESGA